MRAPFRKLRNPPWRSGDHRKGRNFMRESISGQTAPSFLLFEIKSGTFSSFAEKEKKDRYQERIKLLRLRENLRVARTNKPR